MVNLCKKCNVGETHRNYPHCPTCMRELMSRGLCKWCGVGERVQLKMKKSDYCVTCMANAYKSLAQIEKGSEEQFVGKYRTPDHKELVRETKFGTR